MDDAAHKMNDANVRIIDRRLQSTQLNDGFTYLYKNLGAQMQKKTPKN